MDSELHLALSRKEAYLAPIRCNVREMPNLMKNNLSPLPAFEDSTALFAKDTYMDALVERDYRMGPHVLIIEDEPTSNTLLSHILSGHVQERANRAEEGLCLYARMVPDIVFLDIGLPDGNGLHVLQTIMEHDQMAYVVMITASPTGANVQKAISLGAKGFIAKPFTVAQIQAYLKRWHEGLIASRKRKVQL